MSRIDDPFPAENRLTGGGLSSALLQKEQQSRGRHGSPQRARFQAPVRAGGLSVPDLPELQGATDFTIFPPLPRLRPSRSQRLTPPPLLEHPFVVAKALESNRTDAAAEWLTYWVTFSLFTVIELLGGSLLSWIPFYSFLKLGFLSWLLLPKFKGASKLYQSGVQPLIRKHEAKIDQGLNQGYETAMSFQKNGLAAITQRFTSSGQRTN